MNKSLNNVMLIIFLSLIILFPMGCKEQKMPLSPQQFRTVIDEAIPPGSTKEQVVTYLKKNNIAYSPRVNSGDTEIYAVIKYPKTKKQWLIAHNIQIVFYFKKDILKSYDVKEYFTGP